MANKIYAYKDSSEKLYKALEVNTKFIVTYDRLKMIISHILSKNNCEISNPEIKAKLFTKITKSNILKEVEHCLWLSGIEWFDHDHGDIENYSQEADAILYKWWPELWEDGHKK